MPLTETVHEVFVATMNKFLSNSYDALEETITHTKSLKIKIHLRDNFKYLCASILVDYYWIEFYGAFKPENLGPITHIYEKNPSLGNSEVQGGHRVYQETLSV